MCNIKDVESIDPSTYKDKNVNLLAWRIYSYLGAKEPSLIENPERKSEGASGRAAQRKAAEVRAHTRRGEGEEKNQTPLAKDKQLDQATRREILDIAAKLHFNANTTHAEHARHLKTIWRMALDEDEKRAAADAYKAYCSKPPPDLQTYIEMASVTHVDMVLYPEVSRAASSSSSPTLLPPDPHSGIYLPLAPSSSTSHSLPSDDGAIDE